MSLEGAMPAPEAVEEEQLPGLMNYFLGNDPSLWVTNVRSYGRVRYRDVYPGIDAVYYARGGAFEHDFEVRPGTDPNRIRMRFDGADDVRVEGDGSLGVIVGGQRITWGKPVVYQTVNGGRRLVAGSYTMGRGGIGFAVGNYDRLLPLVIDPVITYATYFGRSSAEAASRIVVDAAGNSYLTGMTRDPAFPRTGGAYSGGLGPGNLLVVKLDPSGSTVLFSTFIGGADVDGGLGLALDRQGNLYLAGNTHSNNYPTTPGAFKPALTQPGAPVDRMDCVVTKLNASGNALLYSTYLGGALRDSCFGIAVDAGGNAYLTGNTESMNFPVSEDAPQRLNRGLREGFITKLNATGSGIVYSTLFGGNRNESGAAIAVDNAGAAYVTGNTTSTFGFPITANAFQRTYLGTTATTSITGDAYVLKLNPAGTAIEYSTYVGGSRDELGFAIAVDAQGNVYVGGNTTSPNFPTTSGAYQTNFRGLGGNTVYRGGDAFALKLSPDGSRLIYSTLLGGSSDDWGAGIAIDGAGNAYLTGATLSPDFPVTADAHQRAFGGFDPELGFNTGDAFLAHINPAGSALVYSTFLGGSADEFAYGIALDSSNGIHISGMTRSRNFPATPNVAQRVYGGTDATLVPMGDVFAAKFGGTGGSGGTPASTVALQAAGSAASYAAGGVAPGEIVVLGGANIGPAGLATLSVVQGRIASTISGTRVLFDGVPAPLLYASARQTSAIVPYEVGRRATTQIVVEFQGQRSAALTMPVVSAKPALFSANGSGTGPGAILNEDYSVNTASNPVATGRVIQLFGTGEGDTSPPGIDGLLAVSSLPRPLLPVVVTIGGRTADVLYAGAAPGQVAGLFQINAKVPEDTPAGNQEVIVTIGTARSQPSLTVAVR